jgi:preprotein translocase subunit SecE
MTMSVEIGKERKKRSYFREVLEELKKVNWTPRSELIASTRAVVLATFVFGFAVYGVDLIIRGGLNGVGTLFRWIFG